GPVTEPASPPAQPKEKPAAPKKDKPPRLTVDEATAVLQEHFQTDKRALPFLETFRAKELSDDEVWDKLGAQLFRLEQHRGFPLVDVFVIRNKVAVPLQGALRGFRLRSFCVADLRGDGKPLLVYSYTWDLGASRAEVAVLDIFAKEPAPVVAAQWLWPDPDHSWDVKTADGKSVRVEGGGVTFGDLLYQEKDGKASLRIKFRDGLPAGVKRQLQEN